MGIVRKKGNLYFALDIVVNVVIIVLLAWFIRTYLVSPFHVSGPSMCDTLNKIDGKCVSSYGEYIIVDEFSYQSFFGKEVSSPKFGDIVIFNPPGNDKQYFVKRIIGVPGDKIKIEDGYVYFWEEGEFKQLDESEYLNEDNLGKTFTPNNETRIYEVPEDKYFVLGDNRNQSTDSRQCFRSAFGSRCTAEHENTYVPEDMLRGKAWVVFWPITNMRALH